MSTPVLFAVQSPDMSEALLIDGNTAQSDRYVIGMAKMHMLKTFDVWLEDDWKIEKVDQDTEQGYSIF